VTRTASPKAVFPNRFRIAFYLHNLLNVCSWDRAESGVAPPHSYARLQGCPVCDMRPRFHRAFLLEKQT
jgi:hypothetical protein